MFGKKKDEPQYAVRYHMYVSVDKTKDGVRENIETKSTKTKIIFKGSLDQCKNFVKIQLLDAMTTLIDLDGLRTEFRVYGDSYEGVVNIYNTINKTDRLWFNSSYHIDEYYDYDLDWLKY